MKKEEFVAWAESKGWTLDRWGHLKKEVNGSPYRFKLSRIAVRYEAKSASGWVRIRSGYFSKLSISTEGKIVGLKR